MRRKILASCLLLAGAAAAQAPRPGRASLDAELTLLSRSGGAVQSLTAAVKLTNNSSGYIYILLVGRPSAVDNAGRVFNETESVSGVTYCPGIQNPPSKTVCIGRPADPRFPVPLVDSYTEIPPQKSASFNIAMRSTGGANGGTQISLSQELAYRLVKEADLDADGRLPEEAKLKNVRLGSISFTSEPGPKEVVTSRITFADVK